MHGALGSKAQLAPLAAALPKHVQAHTFDLQGHGPTAMPPQGYHIPDFAQQLHTYIKKHNLQPANVFGYSMGGYIALYLAAQHPQAIGRLMTLGTKLNWTPQGAAKEAAMLNHEKISQKVPAFAKTLQQRHAPNNWITVLENTAQLMHNLGSSNLLSQQVLAAIQPPVTIGWGQADNMVTEQESALAAKALPHGQLWVAPDTPHPIEKVPLPQLINKISQFFSL